MTNIPRPVEELRLLDLELRQLDLRRSQLLTRRTWLLAALQATARQVGPGVTGDVTPGRQAAHEVASAPTARPAETGAPGVQNILLVLGGTLLTIAAIAFTVVSWGHLGIGGRSAVLGAVTLAALGAPTLLPRRGLRSTAEALGGLGLALTVLDAYALHGVALAGSPTVGYAAGAAAVLAAVWVGYGRWLRALRLPWPAAVAAAQLPLLLWSTAAGAGPHMLTAALLATAALDTVLALRPGDRPTRLAAATGACATGAWSVLAAGTLAWQATDVASASRAAGLLATAALVALYAARRSARVPSASVDRTMPVGVSAAGSETASGSASASAGTTVPPDAKASPGTVPRAATASPDTTVPLHATASPGTTVALGAAIAGGLLSVAAAGSVLARLLPPSSAVPGFLVCGVALGATTAWAGAGRGRRGATEAAEGAQGSGPAGRRPTGATEGKPGNDQTGPRPTQTTEPTQDNSPPAPRPTRAAAWADAGPVRRGLAAASAIVHAAAVLWALPMTLLALAEPVAWVDNVWSGAPSTVASPTNGLAGCAVLAVATGALFVFVRPSGHPAATAGGLTLAWAAAAALPGALHLPYAADLSAYVLLTVTLLSLGEVRHAPTSSGAAPRRVVAAPEYAQYEGTTPPCDAPHRTTRKRTPPPRDRSAAAVHLHSTAPTAALTALLLALATSCSTALLSLATESATLGALAALTAAFAAVGTYSHRSAATSPLTPVTASAALAYATGLASAAGAALGLTAPHIALPVLVVPVAAALIADRLSRTSRPAGAELAVAGRGGVGLIPAVEITGALAGCTAVGLAVTDVPLLSLVLALCGVIAAGTALREERRVVGYAASVLFALATWARLAAWDVHTPEAYTLPVTTLALAVGALRRRRDTAASSWTAYGPGLAATLVPSLLAAWGDPHWLRPLLLGIVALLVTLAGARHRLQAPLVLGGATVALDALHELAPYVVQVIGALPRWLPPALAGALLLALGATYEQRLRDARRLRDAVGRLR